MATNQPKFRVVDISGLDTGLDEITKGFSSIKVRRMFPETIPPCDIFCLAQRSDQQGIRLGRLLGKDQLYKSSFQRFLNEQEVDEAYIKSDDKEAFNEYLNRHAQEALQNGNVSAEKKAELLYDHAEYIVEKAFMERPSRANIGTGQQLVAQFSSHVLADQITSQALLSLFSKDYYTFSHCVQVAFLGMSLCKALGWKTKEVEDFGLGALFHDIGKNAIDERILNKPGKLEKDEFELIQKHPLLGYQQIKNTQVMTKDQLSVVLHHHEALDGSGYPYRLKELDIHKYARVARIVDIYDALTTKRSYKEALPIPEALRIMSNEMKQTLDVRFFAAFIKLVQTEKKTEEVTSGMQLELGIPIQLQIEGQKIPFKSVLAGQEVNQTLMLRIPALEQIRVHLKLDGAVTGRYVQSGALYTFHSAILKHVVHPFPLLFLSYPQKFEKVDLRKEVRTDCFIQAKVLIGKDRHAGVIVDLSQDGCRVVIKFSSGCSPQAIAINQSVTLSAAWSGKEKYESLQGVIRNARMDNERAVLGVHFAETSSAILEIIDRLRYGSIEDEEQAS